MFKLNSWKWLIIMWASLILGWVCLFFELQTIYNILLVCWLIAFTMAMIMIFKEHKASKEENKKLLEQLEQQLKERLNK